MAECSVSQLSSLINQQIDIQENLAEYLYKAEAIANVALSNDFHDYSPSIIHDYIWALCDLINQAKSLSEKSLDELFKNLLRNKWT